MESRVFSDADVAKILSARFVAVKMDCDNPDGGGEALMSKVTGNTLPFCMVATPDGKFISGTSGFRDVAAFKADLQAALASPLLAVPAPVEKQLEKTAAQAAKDFEAGKWSAVYKAGRTAAQAPGFSPSKDRIAELVAKANEAGEAKMKEAAAMTADGKFDEAKALAAAFAKDWKGTDLEKASTAAVKAVERFKSASIKAQAGDAPGARKFIELVVKECAEAPPFVQLAQSRLKE